MTSEAMIAVEDIYPRKDARPLNEDFLPELADSIRAIGLDQPLTVRLRAEGGYELIAGNHRFAAIDCELGWSEVQCNVVDDDDLHAELRMLDENLMRAELSTAERAKALGRRKAIYEELHPDTRHGTPGVSRQVGDTRERTEAERFTANTAAVTGRSERAVQRDVDRGESIAPEALDVVSGTHRDTGKYLDELKAVPREQQVEKAKRDVAAPKPDRSARAPAPLYRKDEAADAAKPDIDPFASWIELTQGTATLTAKAIFEACPVRSRPTLSQRCEAIRAIIDELDDLVERPHLRGAA